MTWLLGVWIFASVVVACLAIAGAYAITGDGYRGTHTRRAPRQPVQRQHRAEDLDEGTITIRQGRYYKGRGV